jgi:membrane-associated protease RseP (regulator of RpoE activity)
MKYVMFGQLLPAPADFGFGGPLVYWLRYFFTGTPYPIGGQDVILDSVAWAGWAGLLITGLNLIPAGQLDGGHTLFVLIGDRVRKLIPVILVILVALGFFWMGWWLWAAIIYFLNRRPAELLDEITPLDGRRKAIAIAVLIIFLLIITPVPLTVVQ